MLRTTTKTKGHRSDRVKYAIPFYTEEFFGKVRDDVEKPEPKTVKFPVLIDNNAGDTRSNTTYQRVNVIEYFDNEAEKVLRVFNVINQRLIKPKQLDDEQEEAKLFLSYLKGACSETATSTLDSVTRTARQELWDAEFVGNETVEAVEDNVIDDEMTLYALVEEEWNPVPDGHDNDADKYRDYLLKEYKRRVLNGLYQIVFGADAYRAHRVQKEYLMHQIIKPFWSDSGASLPKSGSSSQLNDPVPSRSTSRTYGNRSGMENLRG